MWSWTSRPTCWAMPIFAPSSRECWTPEPTRPAVASRHQADNSARYATAARCDGGDCGPDGDQFRRSWLYSGGAVLAGRATHHLEQQPRHHQFHPKRAGVRTDRKRRHLRCISKPQRPGRRLGGRYCCQRRRHFARRPPTSFGLAGHRGIHGWRGPVGFARRPGSGHRLCGVARHADVGGYRQSQAGRL